MNRLFVKILLAVFSILLTFTSSAWGVSVVQGQAVDIETKQPLADTNIYIDIANTRYSTVTTEDGRFAIPINNTLPMNASISSELNLYNTKVTPITINPDEDMAITLYMKRVLYDFTLTIYDYKTQKVIDPRKITFANISDSRLFNIRLDEKTIKIGFNSAQKPEGILILKSPEYAPAAVRINKNNPNHEVSVYLPQLSKEKMFGVITNKNGDALIDAKIVLEEIKVDKKNPPKRYNGYTNYAGLYTLDYVAAGKYKCIVSKAGYSTRIFGLIVQPDIVVEHNIELDNAH